MSTFKNILIIGASGNLGDEIVPALINQGHFNVTISTRAGSENKHDDYKDAKIITVDYKDHDALRKAFTGQDVILSMVGTGGVPDQTTWIDIASEVGVKRFIPSEFGSALTAPGIVELGVMDGKIKVDEYLKEQARQGKIEYTTFVTGPFVDWCTSIGIFGIDSKTNTATLFDDGNSRFTGTPQPIIAQRVVEALQHPEQSRNKEIKTFTHTVSQNSLLAAAEKVTGEKWTVKQGGTADENIKSGFELVKEGNRMGFFKVIQGMVLNPDEKYGAWQSSVPDSRPEEVEELVRKAFAANKVLKA